MTTPERTFVYNIDASNRVVSVTPEWESFAQENQASQLTPEAVCGEPLFRFVCDKETRHLYEMIIERVRRDRRTIVVPFRCDGPSVRRFMELTVSLSSDGNVQFEGRIVSEEDRETVSLLAPAVRRNTEFVVVCSWCKRVKTSGEWLEVEEAVRQLSLFHADDLPRISHGMCVDCLERVRHELEV